MVKGHHGHGNAASQNARGSSGRIRRRRDRVARRGRPRMSMIMTMLIRIRIIIEPQDHVLFGNGRGSATILGQNGGEIQETGHLPFENRRIPSSRGDVAFVAVVGDNSDNDPAGMTGESNQQGVGWLERRPRRRR